jgi:hypothetical protein
VASFPRPTPAMPVLLLKSPASPAQSSRGQTASPAIEQPTGPVIRCVDGKANVPSACGPCKRAHLACDVGRPCKRCINMGKEDQCEDIPVSLSERCSRISRTDLKLNYRASVWGWSKNILELD